MNRNAMNRIVTVTALAVAVAWPAVVSTPVKAQALSDFPTNSNITVDYVEPRDARFQGVYERVKKRQVLEELAQFLSPLRLPHTLRLKTKQCGVVNAFYDPSEWSLNICYELILDGEESAPQTTTKEGITRDQAIVGNFVDTTLHELGHAMFDILEIPVLGREEDAADQFSGFLMLQFGKDVARTGIKGAAYYYIVSASRRGTRPYPFYNEHGTDEQRMYNYLCLGYGGEPAAFQDFVDMGLLPKARAADCAREYARAKAAFAISVLPHIDQELMKKVQARQWLLPGDGK
jgi:hypothetical protein